MYFCFIMFTCELIADGDDDDPVLSAVDGVGGDGR